VKIRILIQLKERKTGRRLQTCPFRRKNKKKQIETSMEDWQKGSGRTNDALLQKKMGKMQKK